MIKINFIKYKDYLENWKIYDENKHEHEHHKGNFIVVYSMNEVLAIAPFLKTPRPMTFIQLIELFPEKYLLFRQNMKKQFPIIEAEYFFTGLDGFNNVHRVDEPHKIELMQHETDFLTQDHQQLVYGTMQIVVNIHRHYWVLLEQPKGYLINKIEIDTTNHTFRTVRHYFIDYRQRDPVTVFVNGKRLNR